ncbi:MAG: LysM peptidoglycan-binding domain-containing protein, partial [Mycobacterium sp.]
MTLIETIPPTGRPAHGPVRAYPRGRDTGRTYAARTGPARSRPGGAPLRYRSTGLLTSRAPHRRRPITPATTVALALLAALITVWLGLVAHFGAAVADTAAAVPDQLGVVRVQAGESLQQLAARVAPDAPAGQMVDRIRELNKLDSVALDAGQTLI